MRAMVGVVVAVVLEACGGFVPTHQAEATDAGCDSNPAQMDAGQPDAGEISCSSDAGMADCWAAVQHRSACCGNASAEDPGLFCTDIARVALDPVQRCEDIAAADCPTILASGLCH